MNQRSLGWPKAVAVFLAGCVVTFVARRYWPIAHSISAVAEQTNTNKLRFQADFSLPKYVQMNSPSHTLVLSFYIQKANSPLEAYPVTIQNATNQPYRVTYELLAYDGCIRRLDDTTDSVTIAAKETVLRQVHFSHPLSVDFRSFASFRLIADIEN